MGFYSFFGVADSFDPELRLVTSCIISPKALFFYRAAIALYSFVALIFNIIWYSVALDEGEKWITYFTNLSFVGVCAYFIASAIQSWSYLRNLRTSGERSYDLQTWHPILQFLHVVLFSTIAVCPFVVLVVVWEVLRPKGPFSTSYLAWDNTTFHILNAVFAFFEIILGRCKMYWSHLIWVQLVGWSYLALAYVVYETQGFYTYSFLNPAKGTGRLLGYIFGIAVGFAIIFVLTWFLCWLRDRIFKGKVKTGASKPQDLEEKKDMEPVASH